MYDFNSRLNRSLCFLGSYIRSESPEFLFQAGSTSSSVLYVEKAVVSDFAYQRLQMAARDNCGKSELWYLEIMKNV